MKRDKTIILTARVVSLVFTPFYLPILGLIALFTLSYLRMMPWPYKFQVLIMVYLFTVLLPTAVSSATLPAPIGWTHCTSLIS